MGSEVMPRHPYLWKRGGTYYIRRRVPTHLVPVIGKSEITRSLRTSNYREASKLADVEIAKIRLAFERAEAALSTDGNTRSKQIDALSFSEIETLVQDWFDRSKTDLLENWSFRATGCNDSDDEVEAERQQTLAGIEEQCPPSAPVGHFDVIA